VSRLVLAPFVLAPLFLAGCFNIRYTESPERPATLAPAELEKDIRAYFKMKPELVTPARVAVVESGTDEFRRLVAAPAPSGPGQVASDPLLEGGTVALAMPFTGSSLLSHAQSEVGARMVAARAQADVLLVVDYAYRDGVENSILRVFDLTIVGMGLIPSQRVHTEVLARAVLVDVRNGLIYGIAEVRLEGPRHILPTALVAATLEKDRESLHADLYRELAKRVRDMLVAAKGQAEKAPAAP